jgi:hypothetical protein
MASKEDHERNAINLSLPSPLLCLTLTLFINFFVYLLTLLFIIPRASPKSTWLCAASNSGVENLDTALKKLN